jgi:hypothetical protein
MEARLPEVPRGRNPTWTGVPVLPLWLLRVEDGVELPAIILAFEMSPPLLGGI